MKNIKLIKTHTTSIAKLVDSKNPRIVYAVFTWEPGSGVWVSRSANPAFDYHANECEDIYDAFAYIDELLNLAKKENFHFIPMEN